MKKLFLTLLLSLLLVSNAWAVSGTFLDLISSGSAVSDGLMGTTTHDASRTIYSGNSYHDKFQPTTPGVVNYIHAYISGGNGRSVCLSLHSSTGTKLGHCSGDPGTDVAGWFNCQLNTEVTLVGATDYYLSVRTSNEITLYKRNAGNGFWADSEIASCEDAIGNVEEMSLDATDDICILVNNTAGDPA